MDFWNGSVGRKDRTGVISTQVAEAYQAGYSGSVRFNEQTPDMYHISIYLLSGLFHLLSIVAI